MLHHLKFSKPLPAAIKNLIEVLSARMVINIVIEKVTLTVKGKARRNARCS